MKKDIIVQNNCPPTLQNDPSQINCDNCFNVINQTGAVVNFNITPQSHISTNSTEQMIAVQSFNREYYQLIVTCEEKIFENNTVNIPANQSLTRDIVPAEIFNSCSSLSDIGIETLKKIPAIICHENTDFKGITDPNQYAVFAYIKSVKVEGKNIKIEFQGIGPIRQQILCDHENAPLFDLNMECAITDLNRSGWSVHKVNLFSVFKKVGLHNLPIPYDEVNE